MGNEPSTPQDLTAPLTTITSIPTTQTAIPTTSLAATDATAAASTTTIATTATNAVATTTTNTTTAATTPTPTITSATSVANNASINPVSTEDTSKPTIYSVAKSLMSDADKAKSASSASAQWYQWSKFEQQKPDKGKMLWYMGPPITTTDIISPTTTTLTMTTAKIGGDSKEVSDLSNVVAIPTFQLRSTAIYSPPHGDRVLPGRNELINTDTSVFKYYLPEYRLKQTQPGGIHTKAAMYKMDTRSRQTPLSTQSSSSTSNNPASVTRDNSSPSKFASHDLQNNFESQPMTASYTQLYYYEKQPPQVKLFHRLFKSRPPSLYRGSKNTVNQPVFPPIEKTPVRFNDQLSTSVPQSFPSYPPSRPPTSILKKSSTVLSQDISNPLSVQTHDKASEELRKRNKNTQDGIYRVKKVHLLETNDRENQPPSVTFNLPPVKSSAKANQSISKSEKLFFSRLFNRKK